MRQLMFWIADGLVCLDEKSNNEKKALAVIVVAGLTFT